METLFDKPGSNRKFGLTFAVVFAVIALWPLLHGANVRLWPLAVAAAFVAAASFTPQMLTPLNRLWFRIGIVLGKVVTPVVMAVLWFAVVTPVGLLMRLFGKDPLRLKFEPEVKSYWINRMPPGPAVGSLNDQF